MNVSVVTITQYKRAAQLKLLLQCILAQTRRPDEWVIVEGSPTRQEAESNAEAILELRTKCPIPIVYVPYKANAKLGQLRNMGNAVCKGDCIVCMDDDDYYFPERVQHVLDAFTNFPKVQLAGCSNLLFYDWANRAFYQCAGFHTNHSTNNAMAWRQAYLATHAYDDSKIFGEESSFTNNFSEPMIPLLPSATCITSCHGSNTYDKRGMFTNNPQYVQLPHETIFTMMPKAVYEAYLQKFSF